MDLVAGPLGSVIAKLALLLKDEYDLQTGVRKKITRLAGDLESMHAVLRKVADVPPDQLDDEVKLWARDVRELSYDVEGIVDNFLVHVDGQEARDPKKFKRVAKKIGQLFWKIKARHQIDSMIRNIDEQAAALAERHRRYRAEDIVSRPAPLRTIDPRIEAMYKAVTQLVGIEKPSGDLISMLSSPSGNQEMKMVSVVGAGGLGKTTLAKAVYDKLKGDFMYTAFVSVGRHPDLTKVIVDILIELDKEFLDPKYRLLDGNQLVKKLREYLQDKRYFIVIDDVWETETWTRITYALVRNNDESRVILTTRHSYVANQVGEVYKLEPLSPDPSEKLFYTRIFGANGKCPNNELKAVAEKVLNKCHGVPLAIITMASLLVGKTPGEWMDVCNSIIFRGINKNQQVSDTEWILSLGYYDLPSHLKACLLYLSVFPEDHVIDKETLIRKWMAEGFVRKEPGTRLYEVGEIYFNELINRSMIQAVETERGDMVYGCRIHDMILDLIRVKSREENFVTILSSDDDNEDTSSPHSKIRRLAYQNRTVEQTHKNTQVDLGHVRTFILVACRSHTLSFMSFQFLRILALEGCNSNSNDGVIHLEHIESLLHLRYLGIIKTDAGCKLPKGIGVLKFLQTLDIQTSYTYGTDQFPSGIGMLTQLICLRAARGWKIPNGTIQKLTSLEELQIYCSGDMSMQSVNDIGNLCELRVLHVSIDMFDNMDNFHKNKRIETDLVESLGKLLKLQHLELSAFSYDWCLYRADKDIWDAATLPRTLRHIFLSDIVFSVLPRCINPSDLPNLTLLEVFVCHFDVQSLRTLGRLPELRHLKLLVGDSSNSPMTMVNGLFQKLVSLSVPFSSVHFALSNDSSVTFSFWCAWDSVAFDSEKGDKLRMVHAPAAVMPNLQQLEFGVNVLTLMDSNCSCDRLGLESLPSLRKVKVNFNCSDAFADDVDKEEAVLRHTIEAHPNRPTLQIDFIGTYHMKSRRATHDSVTEKGKKSRGLIVFDGS